MSARPPVLPLHGLGTSADTTWRTNGWIDLLGDEGREVIAPDLLGHGAAPRPIDPVAYTRLEAEVADQLPPGPIDAIGFSLGARILLTLAASEPERFRRLVVAGVGANLFRPMDPEPLAQALEQGRATGDPGIDYFIRLATSGATDGRAMAALLRSPGRGPLDPAALRAVTLPVLVVMGGADFAGPPDPPVDALPEARLLLLARCDHASTPKDLRFLDAAITFLADGLDDGHDDGHERP